jgi:hypothetical protein
MSRLPRGWLGWYLNPGTSSSSDLRRAGMRYIQQVAGEDGVLWWICEPDGRNLMGPYATENEADAALKRVIMPPDPDFGH